MLLLFLEADLYSLIRKPQYQLVQSIFGISDAFTDEKGRNVHLTDPITTALMANANELLTEPPKIERVDVLAIKISG
jgi:quinol monooxygenase YgiN